jgi:hypothetical protein
MVITLVLRFVLGGAIVTAFAALSDMVRPKSFAGIFGAAPSVALASLGLAFATKSGSDAALDGRSMLAGALALCAYSLLTAVLIWRRRWGAIRATGTAMLAWFAVAFGLWALAIR